MRREWTLCDPDFIRAQALVVLQVMAHNRSSHDDAVWKVSAELPGCATTAKQSDVEDFLPTAVAAHGVVPLRFVFEIPRDRLAPEVWQNLAKATLKVTLSTIRGKSHEAQVDLDGAFDPLRGVVPLDDEGKPTRQTPPIKGYTEVRSPLRQTQTTFLGPKTIFEDYDLW